MDASLLAGAFDRSEWGSPRSPLLLNPRWPESESARLTALVAGVPELPAHVWLASSGTTGTLKCVAISKQALLNSARSVNEHLGIKRGDPWLSPLPMFHVGGLGIEARAVLSESPVFRLSQWNPHAFVAECEKHSVAWSSLVPAQVSDLVSQNLPAPSSLRGILVGGGALRESLYHQARALGWPLLPSYGMTETSSQVATASRDSLEHSAFPSLVVLPHLEVSRTSEGRLAIRGSSLFTAYAQESLQGVALVDPKVNGVFTSQDCGDVRIAGTHRLLTIEGRASDFVKVGGESVDLPRLDQILGALLDAEKRSLPEFDAALVAVPDERLGHVIHLAATQLEAAKRLCFVYNQRVLPFERARGVHGFSSLPRTELGKLRRAELLQLILTSQNSRLS